MCGFEVGGVVGSASCEGGDVVDGVGAGFAADVADVGGCEDAAVAFADLSGVDAGHAVLLRVVCAVLGVGEGVEGAGFAGLCVVDPVGVVGGDLAVAGVDGDGVGVGVPGAAAPAGYVVSGGGGDLSGGGGHVVSGLRWSPGLMVRVRRVGEPMSRQDGVSRWRTGQSIEPSPSSVGTVAVV